MPFFNSMVSLALLCWYTILVHPSSIPVCRMLSLHTLSANVLGCYSHNEAVGGVWRCARKTMGRRECLLLVIAGLPAAGAQGHCRLPAGGHLAQGPAAVLVRPGAAV